MMTQEFNRWWDADELTQTNPYEDGTPAYWAWEGWLAGIRAEREECAKVCDRMVMYGLVAEVQQRYNKAYADCRDAIRNRSNA